MDLRVVASARESVPGAEARGRMWISSVACEGSSWLGLTSMGPESEAKDWVCPGRG